MDDIHILHDHAAGDTASCAPCAPESPVKTSPPSPQLSFLIEEYKVAFQTYLLTQTKDENVSKFFFTTCLIFGASLLFKLSSGDVTHMTHMKFAISVVIVLLFCIGIVVGFIVGKLYQNRLRAAKRMNYIRRYITRKLPDFDMPYYEKIAGFPDPELMSDLTTINNNKGQFILIGAFEVALMLALIYVATF